VVAFAPDVRRESEAAVTTAAVKAMKRRMEQPPSVSRIAFTERAAALSAQRIPGSNPNSEG
jgi:hypothetical protein